MSSKLFALNQVEIAVHTDPRVGLVEIVDSGGSVILNFKEMDYLIRAYEAALQDKALEMSDEM